MNEEERRAGKVPVQRVRTVRHQIGVLVGFRIVFRRTHESFSVGRVYPKEGIKASDFSTIKHAKVL